MFEELYKSFLECSKNKSGTINALDFIINKERNLMKLKYDIENKLYFPWKSIYFIVTKPKIREIFAADFRDRIIHHFFIRAIEKNFYNDMSKAPYSCIKWKWTHWCITDIKKIYREYRYYLQIDIRSFFMTIDKSILKNLVSPYLPKNKKECINNDIQYDLSIYSYLLDIILSYDPVMDCVYRWNEDFKKLLPEWKSLFHTKKWVWLPIGNYTSQFFANIYLNNLDKYVYSLGFKDYFRYVDDLVIFWNDYKELQKLELILDDYLNWYLNMSLAKNKTKLKSTKHGLDFLWYFIKPEYDLVRRRVKHNFAEKLIEQYDLMISYFDIHSLKKLSHLWDSNIRVNAVKVINFSHKDLKIFISIVASYVWHMEYACSKHLLKKLFYRFNFLMYFFTLKNGYHIHDFLKKKKFSNKYKSYLYFDSIYENTILFYPINTFYIFRKKYLYLLDIVRHKHYFQDIIIYPGIWFKIKENIHKLFIIDILKQKKNILLLLAYYPNTIRVEKLFICS